MKTNLLVVICTYRRPQLLNDTLKSLYATKSPDTDVVVYLQDDDPCLEEYKRNLAGKNYIVDKHRDLADCYHHVIFERYPNIPYYQSGCDDFIYKTPQWDKILTSTLEMCGQGHGFACGSQFEDPFAWYTTGMRHAVAETYSWRFINMLGYIYPKGMKHFGLDLYVKDIGECSGGTIFCHNVRIDHIMSANGIRDANIEEVYKQKNQYDAFAAFKEWRATERPRAIRLICEARLANVNPEGWEK